MRWIEPLANGAYYQIYNQGINGEDLFSTNSHYEDFLIKYEYYLKPVVDTLAYSLSQNHFHLLVYVKPTNNHTGCMSTVSRQFGHFFNAYAQAFNRQQGRTGGLFESPFRRRQVKGATAIADTFHLIHHDPEAAGVAGDFRKWPHSSYASYLENPSGILSRNGMLDWFGTKNAFIRFHKKKLVHSPYAGESQSTVPIPFLRT